MKSSDESPISHRSSASSITPPSVQPSTSSTSSFSSDHKIIRKRNRVPLSCNFCRQRKLKCNRGHPCENCIKRGEEGSCVYLLANNGVHAVSPVTSQQGASSTLFYSGSTTSRPAGVDLQNRLEKLESLVLGLMHATTNGEDESPGDTKSDGSTPGRSQQHAQSPNVGEFAPAVDAVRESLGMLKLDNQGKAMYHGETHWGALLNELSEVKALFEQSRNIKTNYPEKTFSEQQCEDANIDVEEAVTYGFPFNNCRDVDRSTMTSLLPEKSLCDILVIRYFDTFDPIYHIVHRPSFELEYTQYWQDPESADIVWIGMLLGMITIGLQSYRPNESPIEYRGREIRTWLSWHQAAELCLVDGKFMRKGSIAIIRTLILWIMSESRLSLCGKWIDRSWVSMGMVIRVTQSMGLHRDPKWFNISPFQSEIRRRMWSIVSSLDILYSINEGLPLTIRAGDHDVRTPLNINDIDISPIAEQLPRCRSWETETDCSYLLCSSKLSNVLCRIVSGTFSLRPRPGYETILSHDAELRATFASFPEFLRVPAESSRPEDAPYLIMQRMLLDMQFRKSLIVLHRPFAARSDVTPRFKRSRLECIDASLQILRWQNWIYRSPSARETLKLFCWFTDGIMLNHFFHACIMLSIELYTNMDAISPFQRQTIRDAVDTSRQIHAEIGSYDFAASRKHSVIENLLDRFYEMEKLTPEERATIKNENIQRQHRLMLCSPDTPSISEPRMNIDIGQASYDSHAATVRNEIDINNTGSGSISNSHIPSSVPLPPVMLDASMFDRKDDQMDSDLSSNIQFLPEEDEIYEDAPFRVRKLPDPSWMMQEYGPQGQPVSSASPSVGAKSDSTMINGPVTGELNGPLASLDSVVSADIVEGMTGASFSPSEMFFSNDLNQMLSGGGALTMSLSPGNEVPQGASWMDWDAYINGMEANMGTENSALSPTSINISGPNQLGMSDRSPAQSTNLMNGISMMPWDSSTMPGHPNLNSESNSSTGLAHPERTNVNADNIFESGHANF
ncbi:fungal-specific transcription factor domain-containing protein [Lipomyces oligophaga]|uniref:fungal-specific transcription factor domain-containing protein n=1 Tax=Lipomyces oligophaga TaxID=45792 RepID=UPI0034CD8EC7